MTINQAKQILSEFYEDYADIDNDEGRNYPDKTTQLKDLEQVLQEYAMKIIDKGQWE
jgi:hypothetical protein